MPRGEDNHSFTFSKLYIQTTQLEADTNLQESKEEMVRVLEGPFMVLP